MAHSVAKVINWCYMTREKQKRTTVYLFSLKRWNPFNNLNWPCGLSFAFHNCKYVEITVMLIDLEKEEEVDLLLSGSFLLL